MMIHNFVNDVRIHRRLVVSRSRKMNLLSKKIFQLLKIGHMRSRGRMIRLSMSEVYIYFCARQIEYF